MATNTPGNILQAGKRMAHLFPIPHRTLKKKERETGKGPEKVVNRVMTNSSENSREASFSQRHYVNLMGLSFLFFF